LAELFFTGNKKERGQTIFFFPFFSFAAAISCFLKVGNLREKGLDDNGHDRCN
jgi:hypothetical protein